MKHSAYFCKYQIPIAGRIILVRTMPVYVVPCGAGEFYFDSIGIGNPRTTWKSHLTMKSQALEFFKSIIRPPPTSIEGHEVKFFSLLFWPLNYAGLAMTMTTYVSNDCWCYEFVEAMWICPKKIRNHGLQCTYLLMISSCFQMTKLQAAIKYGEEDLAGAKSLVDQCLADDPDTDINRGKDAEI